MIVVLAVMVVASVVVAALVGGQVWAAAVGSSLVVAYWALELLFTRLGQQGSFGHGMAVGFAGMIVRVTLVLGVLVLIGILARDAFLATTLAFVGTYTVYIFARLFRHPVVPTSQ